MGIAMNILSSIFAQFSNALNLYKEASEKVAISIDELGRFIADVIGFAMENWEEMLLPITDFLAAVVPDGLNPYSGKKLRFGGLPAMMLSMAVMLKISSHFLLPFLFLAQMVTTK